MQNAGDGHMRGHSTVTSGFPLNNHLSGPQPFAGDGMVPQDYPVLQQVDPGFGGAAPLAQNHYYAGPSVNQYQSQGPMEVATSAGTDHAVFVGGGGGGGGNEAWHHQTGPAASHASRQPLQMPQPTPPMHHPQTAGTQNHGHGDPHSAAVSRGVARGSSQASFIDGDAPSAAAPAATASAASVSAACVSVGCWCWCWWADNGGSEAWHPANW